MNTNSGVSYDMSLALFAMNTVSMVGLNFKGKLHGRSATVLLRFAEKCQKQGFYCHLTLK